MSEPKRKPGRPRKDSYPNPDGCRIEVTLHVPFQPISVEHQYEFQLPAGAVLRSQQRPEFYKDIIHSVLKQKFGEKVKCL